MRKTFKGKVLAKGWVGKNRKLNPYKYGGELIIQDIWKKKGNKNCWNDGNWPPRKIVILEIE